MTMLFRSPRRLPSIAVGMPAVVLVLLVLGGCAQLDRLHHRGDHATATPVVAPPPPAPAAPVETPAAVRPLGEIINDDLQHGRYSEGEAALRAYLVAHPKDRLAQSMLRQLTADPQRTLGPVGSTHVVQAGESYSTLAQRYLGDARLFLILARYNQSTQPALLRAGEKLRLPTSGRLAGDAAAEVGGGAARSGRSSVESPAARSQRLQRESLQLLGAGQETQALTRLDAALATDPGLASDRNGAEALRQRVVASCHQRAIVLYRDQKLEPAIALWDRVLAVEPSYEPALAYRARALELQRRLKQL
ncbi:LysM peptidoglycan-binding domain-containing protein [Dyella sp.]|uniref:LysM peptidoglycan-binding domain-containing protein n=1 Tax=Dyella sp. TaxID=1869338 RepID=UPI003F7F8B1D